MAASGAAAPLSLKTRSRAWEFLADPEDLEAIRDDLVKFKIYG
jgi:hypothetical protein